MTRRSEPENWLSMDDAAEYTRLSRATVERATKATDPQLHLEFRLVKGKRLTRKNWCDEWIEREHQAA